MELTPKQLEKFLIINKRLHQEEIRIRKFYQNLKSELDELLSKKIIDDYEIELKLSLFSNDENFCKNKNTKTGNPFFKSDIIENILHLSDDELNWNWNEFPYTHSGSLKNVHICYLMHCLLFHNDLKKEDILAIDDIWLELFVYHQFFMEFEK